MTDNIQRLQQLLKEFEESKKEIEQLTKQRQDQAEQIESLQKQIQDNNNEIGVLEHIKINHAQIKQHKCRTLH